MTTMASRRHGRLWVLVIGAACVALGYAALAAGHARSAAKHQRAAAWQKTSIAAAPVPAPDIAQLTPLPYSDEFDRAELIDRMLSECRGVSYNAYELAQTSGEALWLPAPIQLMVVRVRHPYCAELLRTYAPKTRV